MNKKILIIADYGPIPSTYIRLTNIFNKMSVDYKFIHADHVREDCLSEYDIVIFQRCYSEKAVSLLTKLEFRSILTIYDIDDNLLELPKESNTKYSSTQIENMEYLLKNCNFVTCSTEQLKEKFLQYNENTIVIKNVVDLNKDLKRVSRKDTFRVFVSNSDYFKLTNSYDSFLQVLQFIITNHPNVKLIFWGYVPESILGLKKQFPHSLEIKTDFQFDYNIYLNNLQKLEADLALVPLEDTDFHRFKSNIKYLDYGSLGIPGIYSDVPIYRDCIKDKDNGLLVHNDYTSWVHAIESLLENQQLRESIAKNALDNIRTNYNISDGIKKWTDLINLDPINLKFTPSKCDVIIPVYNSPEWLKKCVEILIKNTPNDYLNKIILIDDVSNEITQNLILDLQSKNDNIICIRNEKNLGFIKSVNKGLCASTAPYILLLNSDCLITKNTIPKLIRHIEKNKNEKIGLISPISNNSPIVTLEMFQGYDFITMNELLEKVFLGKSFDACTIVGNCLLITRDCYENVGLLNEIYGSGYGEETDYQFSAAQKGFNAKIAIDTYVFHKGDASFGNNESIIKQREKNLSLFLSRWGKEYSERMEQYRKNDPIKYVTSNLNHYFQLNPVLPHYEVVFYLPGIGQSYGGVHNVIEIVNELVLNDIQATVIVPGLCPYYEKRFFNFIIIDNNKDFTSMGIHTKAIVATGWNTVYPCNKFSVINKIPLIYFVQGFETFFYNGSKYGIIEETYSMADEIMVISEWLQRLIKSRFNCDSRVFVNGYDEFVFYPIKRQSTDNNYTITMVLRGESTKGDWLIQDIVKLLVCNYTNVRINLIHINEIETCQSDGIIQKIRGPLPKKQIAEIFRQTDIFIDASLHEGFGLFPLEAMACGAVVIVSDSGGVNQFIKDNENGFIIKEVNKPEKYIEKVNQLIEDRQHFIKIKDNSLKVVKGFAMSNTIKAHIDYFKNISLIKIKPSRNFKTELISEQPAATSENITKEFFSIDASEELNLIKSSVSYRIIMRLKKSHLIMGTYRFVRPIFKILYKKFLGKERM